MSQKLIKYINNDDWTKILKLAKNEKYLKHLDDLLINGNSTFHVACIRKKEPFMKTYFELSKKYPKFINPNHTNSDGIPGLHLYFKFGGNNLTFLDMPYVCIQDMHKLSIIRYLLNDIDKLEKLISSAIKYKCGATMMMSERIQKEIVPQIINSIDQNKNNAIGNRFLHIFDALLSYVNLDYVLFFIIITQREELLKHLMNNKININVKSKTKLTPLIIAVLNNRDTFVKIILDHFSTIYSQEQLYNIVSFGGSKNNDRPIHVAIHNNNLPMLELLLRYIEKYVKQTKDFVFNEIDQFHNTYLHEILRQTTWMKYTKQNKYEKKLFAIIDFFIKYSDVNYQNYWGTTAAHMLCKTGMWMHFIQTLKHKFVDLTIKDGTGRLPAQYIKKTDMPQFKLFVNHLKRSNLQLSRVQAHIHTSVDLSKIKQTYGIFNSNMMHSMLYMVYLLKKYPCLYIPVLKFDTARHKEKILFNKLNSYDLSPVHSVINFLISRMLQMFYIYSAHYIIWASSVHYYIDPSLKYLLKHHHKHHPVSQENQNGRYVLIKLTLIIDASTFHSNVILFDRLKLIGRRFEPTGITDIVDGKMLDKKIEKFLTKCYGKITYHNPAYYLGNTTFQLTSGDDKEENKNWGDPAGYCLAWSIWFIETRLSHPDIDDRELIKEYTNCHVINSVLNNDTSKCSTNHYLDFIRKYAIMLDNEKNKILQTLGVNTDDYYNMYPTKDMMHTIIEYFKFPIK